MPAQYTVGQLLQNGATVTADNFVTQADGTTIETMVATYPNGATDHSVITTPGANTPAANAQTIQANILTRQTQIQAFITANPSGAVLTAAQTLVLAKMLNGLCQLLLQQYGSTNLT